MKEVNRHLVRIGQVELHPEEVPKDEERERERASCRAWGRASHQIPIMVYSCMKYFIIKDTKLSGDRQFELPAPGVIISPEPMSTVGASSRRASESAPQHRRCGEGCSPGFQGPSDSLSHSSPHPHTEAAQSPTGLWTQRYRHSLETWGRTVQGLHLGACASGWAQGPGPGPASQSHT